MAGTPASNALNLEFPPVSSSFRCAVMTPDGAAFDGDVSYASLPAWDGQYGVMAGMSPLLDRLGIGPLRLDTGSGTEWFSIEEGFAHVRDNTLTILSEAVYSVNDLSINELQQELKQFESSEDAGELSEERNRQLKRLKTRLELAEHHGGARSA